MINPMKFPVLFLLAMAALASDAEEGRRRFNSRCAGCHGEDGLGGERAPALGRESKKRLQTDEAVQGIILHGIADTGMPAFHVPDSELRLLTTFVRSRVMPLDHSGIEGDAEAGERFFFGKGGCSACHMVHGRGAVKGPDLTEASQNLTPGEVETALRHPNARRIPGYTVAQVKLPSGIIARGFIKNESGFDLQFLSLEGTLHLLTGNSYQVLAREPDSLMPPLDATSGEYANLFAFLRDAPTRQVAQDLPAALPSALTWSDLVKPRAGEWPTYHGQLSGNRYSSLKQVDAGSVVNLSPAWQYPAGTGAVFADHALGCGRRYVCYFGELGDGARRPIGPQDLGLCAAAFERFGWRRRRWDQSRCSVVGRLRLRGNRQCPSTRASSPNRWLSVGHRDGGFASALWRNIGAPDCR